MPSHFPGFPIRVGTLCRISQGRGCQPLMIFKISQNPLKSKKISSLGRMCPLMDPPLKCALPINRITKQECIPVGCVPPAAVAVPGGSPPGTPPGAGTPRSRHPPGADPPGPGPLCGQKHTCNHITLPQTSFAGGNNVKFGFIVN